MYNYSINIQDNIPADGPGVGDGAPVLEGLAAAAPVHCDHIHILLKTYTLFRNKAKFINIYKFETICTFYGC